MKRKTLSTTLPSFRYEIQSREIPQPVQFQVPQFLKGKHQPTLSSSQAIYEELEKTVPYIDKFLKDSILQDRAYLMRKLKQRKQEENHYIKEVSALQYKLDRSDVEEYIKNNIASKIYNYPIKSIKIDHENFMKQCSLSQREVKDAIKIQTRFMFLYSLNHSKLQEKCKSLDSFTQETLRNLQKFYDKQAKRLEDYFPGGYDWFITQSFTNIQESKDQSQNELQSQIENQRNN